MGLLVVLILVVGVIVWAVGNRLVTARNGLKNAFAQIDVQLRRRYHLIPNLVKPPRAT